MTAARTVRLTAAKHAHDWFGRYDGPDDGEHDAQVLATTARTVTLALGPHALADLISDAHYYAEEMSPDNTGDVDYRPAAQACLRALERAGVVWTRRPGTFTVQVES